MQSKTLENAPLDVFPNLPVLAKVLRRGNSMRRHPEITFFRFESPGRNFLVASARWTLLSDESNCLDPLDVILTVDLRLSRNVTELRLTVVVLSFLRLR